MNIDTLIDDNFRGCVLITQNGTTIYEKASGYADLANKIPNTLATKFATASAGKAFVAVGILQLIEKGLLQFTDTLGNVVDFDLQAIDPKVTVEQLLTHTSGVPDYFDESIMNEYEELWADYPNYKIRKNSDLLPLFITKPMMYERGEKFQYNNSGYVILAMIIEKIAGIDFDEYLQTNIFDVCDMKNTGYYELDKLPAKCANSYIWDEKSKDYRTNIYSVDVKGTGAGGVFTTVSDVSQFWHNLLSYKLISEKLTAAMVSRQSGGNSNIEEGNYGYGMWLIKQNDGGYSPYFQGCDPGVSFISEYEPTTKIITTLVSNYCDNVWVNMQKLRECLYNGTVE